MVLKFLFMMEIDTQQYLQNTLSAEMQHNSKTNMIFSQTKDHVLKNLLHCIDIDTIYEKCRKKKQNIVITISNLI